MIHKFYYGIRRQLTSKIDDKDLKYLDDVNIDPEYLMLNTDEIKILYDKMNNIRNEKCPGISKFVNNEYKECDNKEYINIKTQYKILCSDYAKKKINDNNLVIDIVLLNLNKLSEKYKHLFQRHATEITEINFKSYINNNIRIYNELKDNSEGGKKRKQTKKTKKTKKHRRKTTKKK